jgi:hypothetical protein
MPDLGQQTERRTGRYRFPGSNASEPEIREFQSRHFNVWATFRTRRLSDIVRGIYYNIGRQWIELDTPSMIEGARGYTYREQVTDADVELPMPVTNIVSPSVDVEFATLSKRQWVPKVPILSRDPRLRASAKVADDVLKDRLRRLDWPDIRDRFIMNLVVMGTATLRSFWEESYYETEWAAVPEPLRCSSCESLFASNNVNAGLFELVAQGGNPAKIGTLDDDFPDVSLEACPGCGANLAPTELSEETSRGKDFYARPLGGDVPKGNTALELIAPFEYYPENGGIGFDATTERPRIHGIVKVRSLDWVEEHHPELVDKVEPEDAVDLMREHPMLGEWDIVGRYDHSYDSGIFDHHVRVFDMIAEPCMRFPKGRFIRQIGQEQGLIPINDELVRVIPGENGEEVGVPVQSIQSAVWKPREGEFWGKSLPDDLISIQNRINGMDAQIIEARERMGSPNLMAPSDSNLQGPEYRSGYGSGKVFYWDPSPIAPDSKPEVFGSILMPSGVYQERQACMEDSTRIIGPADIESGEAPRNITTTSGLQILGEQAERRRATRERGITTAFQKVWEHQLKMLWTLRLDLDTYESENPDGSWEIKQYDRKALAGQTKVEIERQAYIDKSILVRESTREALTDQLYDPSTPAARKKLLELMGLPTDVNEESNLQIEHAQRQWIDFVDERKVPVIDPGIDDPGIRYAVIGVHLMQEEGKRISEEALWPQILPHIAGWEEYLQELQMQDAIARAKYGQFIPREQADQLYAQAKMQYDEAKTAYDTAAASSQEIGQPMTQPPPEEPPPPVFLPKQPEQQVYAVWQQMLSATGALVPVLREATAAAQEAGQLQQPEEIAEVVDSYMRFRAVFEAYRIMAPPAPAPGVVSPEAVPAAPPGMEQQGPAPTPGTPPLPQTPVG